MKNLQMQIDVAIIGAGTAGLSAYRAAKAAGASAVLIESGEYGTTCARVGCMPSKLLIAAAEAAHALEQAPGFGIHVDGAIRIDGRAVMERVRRERDRFVGFTLREVQDIPEADRLRGYAHFLDDHTLAVDGPFNQNNPFEISAASVVIATGSSAVRPDMFRDLGPRLVINDHVFHWLDFPRRVVVIGTGIIGMELGQALHRLGVKVTVLGRGGRIGPLRDPKIVAYAAATFRQAFALEPDATLVRVQQEGERHVLHYCQPDGAEKSVDFDVVLAATGRTPNVARMGLEKTTLRLDTQGVPLFDRLTAQTTCAQGPGPVFIAGDASNHIPLLHEAADEGRIAGKNAARHALGLPVQAGLRRAALNIVFTDPQIAIVGGGYAALKAGRFASGEASFEDQGRSRILRQNKGLVNLYADLSTGHFLGAEMLAPAAEHLGHLLAWALQNHMTVTQMLEMPFYHPVIEEGLRTALRDLQGKLRAEQAYVMKADTGAPDNYMPA